MFTALLDSCVLWPSTLRDFLLSLAFEGSYRFVFSEAILLEVEVNEELKLMDRGSPREESRSRGRRGWLHRHGESSRFPPDPGSAGY